MSPPPSIWLTSSTGFPRVSGDEPEANADSESNDPFSPRERG